ncbi:LruC domain-containing protein [Bacteroides sp. 214]|uniref:LruC domain-containing protein n=1 Tax=Bacteroides sp. 214 TaxID=2302935 RepID=UPI0013D4658E|nr:LruC domain-containing protein [Bacteroides sp. 214]NDW13219.1 LruC domain-containing protein [Bacteroides sp. 214]
MRKKFFSLAASCCLTVLLISITSCEEKNYFDPNYKDPTASLTPMSFDFSTAQTVKLNLNYQAPTGFVSEFAVYNENPCVIREDGMASLRADAEPIAAGINVAGVSQLIRTIPAYITELYVYSTSSFVPQLMYAKIQNGVANFTTIASSNASRNAATRNISDKVVDFYLNSNGAVGITPDVNTGHKPNYIDSEKTTEIDAAIINRIDAAFPNDKVPAVEATIKDASITLTKAAKVWVAMVFSAGSYDNSLSYFWYNGNKELKDLTDLEKQSLKEVVVFPLAKVVNDNGMNGAGPMKPGEYVQLKYYDEEKQQWVDEFPQGTTIGWMIRANGYNRNTQSISSGAGIYYSVPEWNPEATAENRNHTVIFNANPSNPEEPFNCFGFEDWNRDNEAGWEKDLNDLMFHVMTDPASALIDIPEIPEPGTIETYENKKGILAFEDNWPAKGDYDMNDVVVEYASRITYQQKTESVDDPTPIGDSYVSKIVDRYTVLHNGAQYHNYFSVHVGINPSKVESVTVNGVTQDIVSAPRNPIALGEGFVIEVTPTIKDFLTFDHYYTANEFAGMTSNIFDVVITLKDEELTQNAFNTTAYASAPYNPYISRSPHIQVHLPNYIPAVNEWMKADGGILFGTIYDRSDVEKDAEGNIINWASGTKWYVTGDNILFPFAIHLLGVDRNGFKIPEEYKSIAETYGESYSNWVNSGGDTNKDWYTP